ncbi:MAG TPA: universal stress protein [Steroidobacteraceae bacterium]|nr:universal stress protein [Steroidobacteraceae bacterium]
MDRIQSILVSVDRNDSAEPTLAKGLELARLFRARVELFLCDAERAYALKHEYDRRVVPQARDKCLSDGRDYLRALLARVGPRDASVTIEVECESPLYEGIVHRVQQSLPDLVVRAIGGNGATDSTALNAADWSLIRTCPAPLLLTRARPWKGPPRIAAAVDLSRDEFPDLTQEILRSASLWQARSGASVEVVYADAASDRDGLRALDALLHRKVAEAEIRDGHVRVLAGDPAIALPQLAAARHFDLLIMGALAHRPGATDLVGTLTARLVDVLEGDCLLVKPAGYACQVEAPRPDAAPDPAR